ALRTWKADTRGFDEGAGRIRAQARDDAMALHDALASRGLERDRQGARRGARVRDRLRPRLVIAGEAALRIADRGQDRGEIGVLGAAELLATIHDPDIVLRAQGQGILDRRIP